MPIGRKSNLAQRKKSFFWLDILGKSLFEKRHDSTKIDFDRKWSFSFTPSVLIPDANNSDLIWFIADDGIRRFNIEHGCDEVIMKLPLPSTHRTNDGSVAPDGTLYFGTMQWNPDGKHGRLYSFSPNCILEELSIPIGIPNTFIWLDALHVVISDSLSQTIGLYKKDKTTLHYAEQLFDFQKYGGEPDGGVLDSQGMIWLALWGKEEVVCLDPQKKQIVSAIALPTFQVSNCCFGGPELDQLLVTSAKPKQEVFSSAEAKSGISMLVNMTVSGKEKKGFSLCRPS